MSTAEAEESQMHEAPPSPDYQRLVNTLLGRPKLGLTEPEIKERLEAADILPTEVTKGNYAEAFRIATRYLGRGPSHCSGQIPGDITERRRRTISRRKTQRHKSRPHTP